MRRSSQTNVVSSHDLTSTITDGPDDIAEVCTVQDWAATLPYQFTVDGMATIRDDGMPYHFDYGVRPEVIPVVGALDG